MSIDVNAIEQTVEVTAVGDEVNVNIIDQPVLVSVTDQIIEVEASGAAGPQGPAGAGVAAGGTTGQVLSKLSNTNYDTVWVNAGAGTVYSVNASGSTGISVTGGPITGAGTLTITNTAPDQIVGLTSAGTAVITGTYPNFTITANDQYSGTVTSVNLTAGTGISVSGGPITASGSINVVNTSPDQVVSLTGGGTTTITGTYPNFTISSADSTIGTVTSVNMTVPTGLTISGNPITSAGTLALALASGYSIPTTASQATWDAAYNDKINSASVTGTATKTLTLTQQDGGTITANWSDIDTGLTSVGLSMPSAFSVANSPLTSNGTLAVTGAGTADQYVRGDGQLANFPTNVGGGSSVNYYLNGSVNQGTFGGDTYYEMSKTPIIGAGTNFTRTNAQGNGYIASFITDAGDPALLNIPGGNWNLEFYFQASSGGGNPSFYAELYKVSSANVFTLIGSGSTNPEGITNGTAVDQYFTSIPVPQTALLATDRIAIRIFVTPSGRTITLHTEDNNLCEVVTTFSTGLNALNGLTAQVQYFATGTSGTDFAISSATDTHTFNLPIASGTNTGKLSNTDWTSFNAKQNAITLTTTGSSGASTFVSNTLNVPTYTLTGLGGVPSTRSITINGTAFDLSADRTFNVGTVTSVAATAGTGITISGSPITTSGTLTITNSAPDQVVALTASTGISVSGTYPNFTITNTSPSSGGTVTSVGLSSATSGVTIGSSPITTSGTITLAIATATTSQNGLLSSADWTTFNAKQNAITLTTTGTSGAATLVGSTLNVPNYGSALTGYVPYTGATQALNLGTNNGIVLTDTGTNKSIFITSSSTGEGAIVVDKSGTGESIRVNNGGVGSGFYSNNSSTGNGVLIGNSSTGKGLYIDNAAAATGDPFVYSLGGAAFVKAKINYLGDITGNSLIKSGGTSSQYLMADGSTSTLTNPVTGTGTTNYLPKWTSGSAIGNSVIQEASSSIGIGVSPVLKLDVQGNSADTTTVSGVTVEGVTLFRPSNGVGGIRTGFNTTTGDAYLFSSTSGSSLNFGVRSAPNNTAYLSITSGGNLLVNSTTDNGNRLQVTGDGYFSGKVGLGTASPSGKLDVFSSSDVYTNISTSGNSTSAVLSLYNSSGVTDGAAICYNVAMRFGTITGLNAAGFSEKMRLTSSGNLGLGVTPSAWRSTNPAFQIGQSTSLFSYSSSNVGGLASNAFINSSGDEIYIANGFASLYQFGNNGEHRWLIAPSGTAGNAITFTQAMTLDASGSLLIGASGTVGVKYISITPSSTTTPTVIQGAHAGVGAYAIAMQSGGGNLLIGTTTDAGYKLDVNGTGRFADDITISKTTSNLRLFITNTTATTGRSWYLNSFSNGNLYIGNTTASDIFNFSSTGAATFSAGLTVNGGYIRNANTSTTGGLFMGNGSVYMAYDGSTINFVGATATFSSSVTATQYNLSALNTAPATSSSTGTLGEIRIDANHIYVCTATNTWKRVAIATF